MITLTQPPHNVCQPLSLAPENVLKFIPDGMLKIGEDRVTDKQVKSERPCEGVLELRLSHGRLKAWGNPNFEPTSLCSNTLRLTDMMKGILTRSYS